MLVVCFIDSWKSPRCAFYTTLPAPWIKPERFSSKLSRGQRSFWSERGRSMLTRYDPTDTDLQRGRLQIACSIKHTERCRCPLDQTHQEEGGGNRRVGEYQHKKQKTRDSSMRKGGIHRDLIQSLSSHLHFLFNRKFMSRFSRGCEHTEIYKSIKSGVTKTRACLVNIFSIFPWRRDRAHIAQPQLLPGLSEHVQVQSSLKF